jgi:hypothetical protein
VRQGPRLGRGGLSARPGPDAAPPPLILSEA